MALGQQTRMEIKQLIEESIENAFRNIEIVPPDTIAMVHEHDRFINGNGQEGAKVSISLMRQTLDTMKKDFSEFKVEMEKKLQSLTAQFWAIIVILIGTLISVVIDLLSKGS